MICIVGDIYNDVTLKSSEHPLKMRLGGIVHAARGLYALGVEYSIAYFAPSYLDIHIDKYMHEIGCKNVIKLGNVKNSPNTLLIYDVQEVGNQDYEFLLREDIDLEYINANLPLIGEYDKLLLFSGKYDIRRIIANAKTDMLYLDITNDVSCVEDLVGLSFKVLFVSTSSTLFQTTYRDFESFKHLLEPLCVAFVLKENRGGSRTYDSKSGKTIHTPSQTCPIVHSVGVGDVFDSVVTYFDENKPIEENLINASFVAAEYAQTTFIDDFKQNVGHYLSLSLDKKKNIGIVLPWEYRKCIHVYIAAPDFDYVDTRYINYICDALSYHNFTPHRPIKENGQMSSSPSKTEKKRLFLADMSLIDKCQIMIAILLYNDPGTLIEIGVAAQRKMPVLVYDPYGIAKNCMLTELPNVVTGSADVILSDLFKYSSEKYANSIK